MKKVLSLTLVLLMLAVLLTGCNSTKEYTCQNLTITVPSYLEDASDESTFSKFTFALDSSKMAIFGTKEELKGSAPTLDDYVELVVLANNYKSNSFSRKGDYYYHEYSAMVDGENCNYMIGLYDDGSAYWMIQIGAPSDKYEQSTALEILDSVKFS